MIYQNASHKANSTLKNMAKNSKKCGECWYHSVFWSLEHHLPMADAQKNPGLVHTCLWKIVDLSKWFRSAPAFGK